MKLNYPYNFLGSGSLFYYRGIFSGLSNEPMGSASYNHPAMDPSMHQVIAVVNCYQRVLHRYASRIVKNKLVASLIVEEVFKRYQNSIAIVPPEQVRAFLQQSTADCCRQWLRTKSKTLYLRKPKNPT